MDCNVIQVELVAYHLAPDSLGDEQRDAIDHHLLTCADCLRAYLSLKRHVESGARPSDGARKRLRGAVEARYRPRGGERARRFLSRPIPLYQGFAAAAVVLLLAMVVPRLIPRPSDDKPTRPVPGERVDTSRTIADSSHLG